MKSRDDKKLVVVSVRMSEPLLNRLRQFSLAQGRPMGEAVRKAVTTHLDRFGHPYTDHLTDDDRLEGIRNLVEHGPHVLSATEVIMKIKELVT